MSAPDRNLALELVRVTESAALASSRWVGRGDKMGAGYAGETETGRTLSFWERVTTFGEGVFDAANVLWTYHVIPRVPLPTLMPPSRVFTMVL